MLSWYTADLHLHTVLSPCAELTMGPHDIVKTALERKIDIIAITDHNSAENIQAVMQAAHGSPLTVIPGMEVYVREGAHMICLFPVLDAVLEFQDFIYSHLPPGKNDPSMFGAQLVCDKDENILYENDRMIALPTNASLESVADKVKDLDGIFYPAHIDRQSFSIIRVLGFIPEKLNINAVEIALPYEEALSRLRFLKNSKYSIIRASDAHDIEQIGSKVSFLNLEAPTFQEIKMAFGKLNGRSVSLQMFEREAKE